MFEANPVIKRVSSERALAGALTYNGVIHRTGVLLLLTSVTFGLTWRGLQSGDVSPALGIGGLILGLILGLVISFTRITNPFVIGVYAICQGAALGTISYFANLKYPGIALQAVAGTFGCFFVVLWLYSLQVLRATPMFVKVISAALLGIAVLYIADLVAGFFGHGFEIVRGNSGFSIGLSAVIVVLASLSFVIDFAAIDHAIEEGVEEKEGWRFGFALLVGLVWLYIEILRLLTKMRSRD
jgi:uncharacterized YccA/Bax inhibitor family protein